MKIIRVATNDHTLIKNKQKEVVSSDVECISFSITNHHSATVQPEAICLNGMCMIEMMTSLVGMVTKLGSEVEQLKNNNVVLKLQTKHLSIYLHIYLSIYLFLFPSLPLEASVKCFLPLQFLNLRQSVEFLEGGSGSSKAAT
jgi:hypothetical protein